MSCVRATVSDATPRCAATLINPGEVVVVLCKTSASTITLNMTDECTSLGNAHHLRHARDSIRMFVAARAADERTGNHAGEQQDPRVPGRVPLPLKLLARHRHL